eukprot:1449951-Amphidinium_carterae.1
MQATWTALETDSQVEVTWLWSRLGLGHLRLQSGLQVSFAVFAALQENAEECTICVSILELWACFCYWRDSNGFCVRTREWIHVFVFGFTRV